MRVLVADDQLRIAALLKRSLRDDGHTVDVALNGVDALWHAAEFTYDAVVLGVQLPGLDGGQVCRRLRESDRRIPVLMLTSLDTTSNRVRGLDAGADAYLIKPFSYDQFIAQLMAMIRERAPSRPAELRLGELCMNPETMQAWRGETELKLTSKEFALLRLFLTHPGQALSRDQIFERVWDCAHQGSSNLVDQYMLYLRRKLDRPFGVQQLETVRGLGYRLREVPTGDPRAYPAPRAKIPQNI
jgi:two-component system OmpR family response regulator